jgi:hypothetical protein
LLVARGAHRVQVHHLAGCGARIQARRHRFVDDAGERGRHPCAHRPVLRYPRRERRIDAYRALDLAARGFAQLAVRIRH